MTKGKSGRVVVEVNPDLKRRLYSVLAFENSTLKDWFIQAAKRYVDEHEQPSLPDITTKKRSARRS